MKRKKNKTVYEELTACSNQLLEDVCSISNASVSSTGDNSKIDYLGTNSPYYSYSADTDGISLTTDSTSTGSILSIPYNNYVYTGSSYTYSSTLDSFVLINKESLKDFISTFLRFFLSKVNYSPKECLKILKDILTDNMNELDAFTSQIDLKEVLKRVFSDILTDEINSNSNKHTITEDFIIDNIDYFDKADLMCLLNGHDELLDPNSNYNFISLKLLLEV